MTSNQYTDVFNSDKNKKISIIISNYKNNNLLSYQNHVPVREIDYNNKTSIQTYSINIKNNSLFDKKYYNLVIWEKLNLIENLIIILKIIQRKKKV